MSGIFVISHLSLGFVNVGAFFTKNSVISVHLMMLREGTRQIHSGTQNLQVKQGRESMLAARAGY
jgi:hypothetical protein